MVGAATPKNKALKDENRLPILLVFLINLAVLVLAIKTNSALVGGVDVLVKEWQSLIPAGLGVVISGILNEQLDEKTKARLVFWRWADPLPGGDAFTVHMLADPRIDVDALKKKFGPFPETRREQNARWYGMYRSIENDPSVVQAHRNYLFARDYAGISVLLIVVFGSIGFWQIPSLRTAALYLLALIVQYLVVRQAAKNNGIRFVTTVLALKAARD